MKTLTTVSRNLVTKALTEGEIKIMRETRDDPQDENRFVAMRGFLEALPPSAQICSARECVAMEFVDLETLKTLQISLLHAASTTPFTLLVGRIMIAYN
jgi:hypothetical protein